MIVGVAYEGEIARFEVDPRRLVGQWTGPAEGGSPFTRRHVREVLAEPEGFPPLAQSVVPGDRVVIPTDPSIPGLAEILGGLCETLMGSGVAAPDITVLATRSWPEPVPSLPPGVALATHDPGDKTRSAYLATTAGGRRIYLDRIATDADVVLPVGALGYGAAGSYRGPWSEIFPGLTDRQTRKDLKRSAASRGASPAGSRQEALRESAEVSHLLGSEFHVGVVVGSSGAVRVIAGHQDDVRRRGVEAVDDAWAVRIDTPAELVIAGVGVPWKPASLAELASGLATAAKLARVGGKVVLLTRLGEIAPDSAVRLLAELEDPRQGLTALRGHKGEPDYAAARRIARALARADIYLLSGLEPEFVEALGMIPLDDAGDVRRLTQRCATCIAISPAERMRIEPSGHPANDR